MDIQGLKDKILQLAIQGKLVEQDKNDEPASALVQRIKEERDKLVKEGKARKEKPFPEITEEEKPFELPEGWKWVRYGEVAEYKKGPFGSSITKSMFVPKSENTVKIYEQKNAIQKDVSIGDYYITEEKFRELQSFELNPGDIIVSCAGTIGETFIMPKNMEKGIINQALMKITLSEYIEKQFYLMYFDYILNSQITNISKGSAIKNIPPLKHLKSIIFPLPPLAEQKRIVEKVDQLFALIDELDSNKEDLLEVINLTRNQVLQEAIQGKLVEQNPEDEQASVLLERIKEERDKLVKEGKIRKEKPLPGITEEEKPFEIPEGWEWVRLGEVALLNMGQSPEGVTVNDKEGVEFHQGKVCFGDRYLNRGDKYTTSPKKIAQRGDILLSVRAPVGAINITDREICIGRGLCAISSLGDMTTDYYFYIIKAFEEYLIKRATGTTFLAVTALTVNEMIIPLPPLEEQKRIVEKLDLIMEMLDKLQNELSTKM